MWRNRGIAFKLILSISASSGLIFLLIFGLHYYSSRKIIKKDVEANAQSLALSNAKRIETILASTQKIPESLACFLENGSYDKQEILRLLRGIVGKNPEIYGSTIAFEPYQFEGKSFCYAPSFCKSEGSILFFELGRELGGYFNLDWYQIPKELDCPQWSEPHYTGGGGKILMATYSVPFYRQVRGERQFMGVVTADISLEWLQNIVSSIKVLQTGYGFLISKNGTLVTHPLKELIMNETIFGVAEARGDTHMREVGRKMIRGESGFVPFQSVRNGKHWWVYYTPIRSSGWSLAVLFPQNELMADIDRLTWIVTLLGIIGLSLLSIGLTIIARSITKPLTTMAMATQEIARGHLNVDLPLSRSRDEAGMLLSAFRSMQESLKDYIERLTETTASKERIESELMIARDIQMSILPKKFPPFPDREEFDIYALINPAREVGGDFYDFFFVDDEHLCFVIGDVSGKGVPASLFMAVAKTLIKAISSKGIAPGEILTRVNRELSQENDSCMFVTIFCGLLNTTTGEIFYANGGHNYPFILRKQNEVTWLEGNGGLVVGAMEHTVYETGQTTLQPGESIFLYTDGVTEAVNTKEELFSDDRLRTKITLLQGRPPKEVISGVAEEIAQFSHNMPQADDITMMMVRFYGKRKG
ncbi:MAG TPA: SpoIIE family protein phosphatase [Thermodesulfobacteriota bacterium]|nr:SpoIIE family protein phosphatase [Thermodesulfobacteriota bacterium]